LEILWPMQKRMYEGQLRVVTHHPYMSDWLGWPWMARPIWYAFDQELDQRFVRGVFLIGNPVIMLSGLAALLFAAWSWLKKKSFSGFLLVFLWCGFYFCWGLIPRKIAFYYYYYPCAMILTLSVVHYFESLYESVKSRSLQSKAVERIDWMRWAYLGVALGLFFYFFPVLSGMRIPLESFRQWMWFDSWI
jgi:dolichyl-phosphate-mannose-protein mannosyltransferase